MKIIPTQDRIVVEREEAESKTSAGIIIPDTAKEKPMKGKILAVGEGKFIDGKLHPVQLKVGQTVIFTKWSGTEIECCGKKVLIMNEGDILGIIS